MTESVGRWLMATFLGLLIAGEPSAQRTPLVESVDVQVPVAPSPVSIGGKMHLAYELRIANFLSSDVTLKRILVSSPDRPAVPLADHRGPDIGKRLSRTASPADSNNANVVGAGTHRVVYLWIATDEGGSVPAALEHRIEMDIMRSSGPAHAVTTVSPVGVRQEPAVVLSPPLRGGRWVAVYDPSMVGGHRTAIYTIDGRARIPARFAIDWVRLTAAGVFQGQTQPRPPDWNGYGEEVLAVGDGVIVTALDDMPDTHELPDAPPTRHTLENASGNHVALDLGRGRFVFYEHLKLGSVVVKAGDRVKSGQVLGRLGNSGSSSIGPHLHMHMSDANSVLGAEGLPYVFDSFRHLGTFRSIDAFIKEEKWQPIAVEQKKGRKREMPVANAVVEFR